MHGACIYANDSVLTPFRIFSSLENCMLLRGQMVRTSALIDSRNIANKVITCRYLSALISIYIIAGCIYYARIYCDALNVPHKPPRVVELGKKSSAFCCRIVNFLSK